MKNQKFSQRIGKTPVREAIQTEDIDVPLKNRLWNTILDKYFDKLSDYTGNFERESEKVAHCKYIWKEFFAKPIDDIPKYDVFGSSGVSPQGVINFIREWFFQANWYEIYDLIEFISEVVSSNKAFEFSIACNIALEVEASGYRIINDKVVQITTEAEIKEIEEALQGNLKSVDTHLSTALDLLSNRQQPDYRNSIKESISAVESMCIVITEDSNTTLGKALSLIEKKYKLHGALKTAFSALYGYTSDSGGIRHALLEDDIAVTFEDAKFMLVSCSAFINYLKMKIPKP